MCYYASRLLKGAEVHYGITEKECLAVVWAVKHFRVYLHGTKFIVITDHSALKWLMTINDPTGRLARWSLYLQAYDFEIIHRKGKKHTNVDALSRPVLMSEKAVEEVIEEISPKTLDPYEDEHLLHFLKYGKHRVGASKNQVKGVLKEAEFYKLEDGALKYKASPEEEQYKIIVPPIKERLEVAQRAHLLGHFQAQSTFDRLKQKYYWSNMMEDVKRVIAKCLPCIRHQKEPEKEHRAIAIEVNRIFDTVAMDLVFGFPETHSGYKGALAISEYLTKYPLFSQ